MTPRDTAKRARRQRCGKSEARTKLRRAEQFLEAAKLITEEDDPDWKSAGAAVAVLAGIAASDAACCSALGSRSRSQNHHDAEALLESIVPGGKSAATALKRVLAMKDEAHYGFYDIGSVDLKTIYAQVEKLIKFATDTLVSRDH